MIISETSGGKSLGLPFRDSKERRSGEAASCSVASRKGEEPGEQRRCGKALKQQGERCGAADDLRASALVMMILLVETVSLTHRATGASCCCQVCT